MSFKICRASSEAEYKEYSDKLVKAEAEIFELRSEIAREERKIEKAKIEAKITKLQTYRQKLSAKIVERDDRIAESRRRAEEDRKAVADVGHELGALYGDPDQLLKHCRVAGLDEIRDNEFNLNIPRYVDTFEPEGRIEVHQALDALAKANKGLSEAEAHLL
jgi:type I restriction enzyme M protein